jgi:hypothetical protein
MPHIALPLRSDSLAYFASELPDVIKILTAFGKKITQGPFIHITVIIELLID